MYELIALFVLLAVLGGCIALAARQSEKKGEEKAKRERAESDMHDAAELMEKTEDALRNRPRTLNDALDRL